MRNVMAILIGCFLLLSTASYAGVLVDENFENGGSGYIDDTFGTLQIIEDAGNKYARYSLNWYDPGDPSQGEGLFSSLIMDTVGMVIDSATEIIAFDYKYSFEASPKAGYSLNDIIAGTHGGADYFRVAILDQFWTFDHEVFKHSFNSLDFSDELSSTAGLDFHVSDSTIGGFARVEIDVSTLASGLLLGETVQLYMEIANGNEYYNNTNPANLLTLSEFSSSVSLDNTYVGETRPGDYYHTSVPIPEPAACALFVFGMLFLVRRVHSKR